MDTILIVEDSRLVRSMINAAFAPVDGVTIVEASTLAEAKSIIAERGSSLLVALIDLVLPDALRGEVVPWIAEQEVPTIVFTSEFNEETRRTLIRAGVVDYIVKRDRLAVDEVVRVVQRLRENRRHSILAVDDSITMRRFFQRTLRNYRFTVYTASDGVEALSVLGEHPEIRLVITDYTMPEMDGFELVREIRRSYDRSRMAVIGTAGRGNAAIATRFLKEGASDFLPKPFWNEEFQQRIFQNIELLERIDSLETLNETKNRFVGMAAHDLRSPIGSIMSGLELIIDGYLGAPPPEQRELLDQMQRSARGMFDLINDLLDVSAIEAGSVHLDRETVDLAVVVEELIQRHRPAADRKGVALRTDVSAGETYTVFADRRAVEQIGTNLISNAIKYTAPDTEVIVRLKRDDEATGFTVEDRGAGIPKEEQEKLFSAFSKISTKPTAGESSHGLGLAIVKRLVEAHGGSVSLESSDGAGSRFHVHFPTNDHDEPSTTAR